MERGTICFFNSTTAWGGGEKWHYDMALRMMERGWRVVAAADRQGELYRRLSRVDIPLFGIKAGKLGFLSWKKRRATRRLFTSENVDTVIINLPSDLKLAAPAARRSGVRSVIYRRGSAIPVRDSLLNRLLFGKYLTAVIANSKETSRTILERNPGLIDPGRIEVIYNGLDLARWDEIGGSMLYQSQPGTLVIGNAGRMTRQKGQESLIGIASDLKARGIDFMLLIAGEGPLRSRLEEKVSRAGLDDRVLFTGFVRNMKSFMDSLDIFVLTSRWEGFGYVLVEAMASRKPVLALNNSSNPEIVDDGVTGFLEEDAGALASRIAALASDPSSMTRLGEAGRKRVEEMFTIERAVDSLESFLRALGDRQPPSGRRGCKSL